MRPIALLFALFTLYAAEGWAGVVRLPLTSRATDLAPFAACSSSGRLRAFYGDFGTGISIQLTGLHETDGDGVPCSGDEYKCVFKSDFGTVVLRPEVMGGRAWSEHDLCGEGVHCPLGILPIATGNFSVRCYDRQGGDYRPSAALMLSFPAPHDCEGVAIGSLPTPPGVEIARDGVMLSCP